MSGRVTNYGSQLFLKSFFGKSTTIPNTLWIALVTDEEPSVGSTGSDIVEPLTDDYVRSQYPNSKSNWTVTGTETISNSNAIEFPIATSDWGEARYFAVCDKKTGGNVIAYGDLLNGVEVFDSDQVIIAIGGISFTLYNVAYEGD